MDIDRYLENLNEEQKEAVVEFTRPLLVLSGAGSGKTRVITTKIAYAINKLNIDPYNILAVTFTNKAANEMKERVEKMLEGNDGAKLIQIKTFHSFGTYMLRKEGYRLNIPKTFSILDDKDSYSLLKQLYPNTEADVLKESIKNILKAKDQGIGPNDLEFKRKYGNDVLLQQMYCNYENRLREIGNCDFADLITLPLKLLKENESVRFKYRQRFKVILVDEYQDSNSAQFELLKQLYSPENFLCVVGDDDQSIYSFRGAKVSNILNFGKYFENTHIITLNQNYRCSKNILDLATNVINKNKSRHFKDLRTENSEGNKVRVYQVSDETSEANKVVSLIKNLGDYENTAILYRTNSQSRNFERAFSYYNVPYKIIGAVSFYDREEVKDCLASIMLMLNSKDSISFARLAKKLIKGFGDKGIQSVNEYAIENNVDLINACKSIDKYKTKLNDFTLIYDEVNNKRYNSCSNIKICEYLFSELGILSYYQEIDRKEKTFKVDNIQELLSAISEYSDDEQGLVEFLESLSLDPSRIVKDTKENENGVTLITMHNTKGLEFNNVFLVGIEEGIIPSSRAEKDSDIEEERRIFYVAITRARKNLVLSYCESRFNWGQRVDVRESRFLEEADEKLYQLIKNENKHSYNNINSSLNVKRSFNYYPTRKVENKKSLDNEIKNSIFKKGDMVEHVEYGKAVVTNVKSMRGKELVEIVCTNGRPVSVIASNNTIKKI